MSELTIPKTQTAAIVRQQGGPVEFDDNYPVTLPKEDEVLVKVLYTGVCQSDLHTKAGTAPGADGRPITNIKLPHVGGHEGVGRVVAFGPNLKPSETLQLGTLVGIRFASRVCHECEYCLSGREQYCQKATNHLHHEDGSFQQYCVLDTKYLTMLPQDIDPKVVGPALCAGVTAYKAVRNTDVKQGQWLTVIGAGGGLGHFAVQYGLALGAKVLGVDAGDDKKRFVESLGAQFLDFSKCQDLAGKVRDVTAGGTHAVVVTSGHPGAFRNLVDMIRIGGSLCMVGIPPGDVHLDTPIATIVIRGLKIQGNLVGSLKETLEAVELVRVGKVKPHVEVRPFRDLPEVYEMLEKGDIPGRIVLQL
ncbi:Alcohol dehydrogenase 2 [Exophiala dermatitidis]